jgi:hypothetical protein
MVCTHLRWREMDSNHWSPVKDPLVLQIFIMSNLLGRPPLIPGRPTVCQKLSVAEAKQIEGF